jgi:hypothetical protein
MVGWPGAAQDRYLLARQILGLLSWCSVGTSRRMPSCWYWHENAVPRRHAASDPVRAALTGFFAALARLIPRRRYRSLPNTPATLLAWHRKLAAQIRHKQMAQARPPPTVPHARLSFAWRKRIRRGDTADPRRTDETRRDLALSTVWEICTPRARSCPRRATYLATILDAQAGILAVDFLRRHRAAEETVRPGVHRARHPPDAPGGVTSNRRVDCAAGPQLPSASTSGSRTSF